MSKPCTRCIRAMKRYNVTKVYYSLDGGKFAMEKIRDITSRDSKGNKHLRNLGLIW